MKVDVDSGLEIYNDSDLDDDEDNDDFFDYEEDNDYRKERRNVRWSKWYWKQLFMVVQFTNFQQIFNLK